LPPPAAALGVAAAQRLRAKAAVVTECGSLRASIPRGRRNRRRGGILRVWPARIPAARVACFAHAAAAVRSYRNNFGPSGFPIDPDQRHTAAV
jgi:hypothetical protein